MSVWLIASLSVGIVVLLIVFLFVLHARKKFMQVKAILKNIKTQSGISPENLFYFEKQNGNLQQVMIAEFNTFAYYPKQKTISVEKNSLGSTSVFDVTALAHEMGHAVADENKSPKMGAWYALTIFEKGVCWSILPLFLIGFVLSFFFSVGTLLMNISTAFTIMILLNRVITIGAEREASKNGIKILEATNALTKNEMEMSKKMLSVALSTYVFAFYERLFANFILAKKILFKIFRIKPKNKNTKPVKEDIEMAKLLNEINKDNFYNEKPISQNISSSLINKENVIRRPPLDDEKGE